MYPSGENLRKWYSYTIAPLDGKLERLLCAMNRRQLTGKLAGRLTVRIPITATAAQRCDDPVLLTRSYRASDCGGAVSVQAEME